MGAWGTGILQNDVSADVYADFMERFEAGVEPAAIRAELEESYADGLEDMDDMPSIWLAIAKAQWECGHLQPDVLAKVSEIITSEESLGLWEEGGEALLKERKQVLTTFLEQLRKPKHGKRNIKFRIRIYTIIKTLTRSPITLI